jgi:hypothetical protein
MKKGKEQSNQAVIIEPQVEMKKIEISDYNENFLLAETSLD